MNGKYDFSFFLLYNGKEFRMKRVRVKQITIAFVAVSLFIEAKRGQREGRKNVSSSKTKKE